MSIIIMALVLVGCSDDTPEANNEIRLNVEALQMAEGTRATTIDDDDDLQGCDLRIDAYYHDTETAYLSNTKLHYDSEEQAALKWKFWNGSQLHYYWPFEGSKVAGGSTVASTLDFVGFCPYDKPAYIAIPTYDKDDGVSFSCNLGSYMTNTAQADMDEYLIAVLKNQTYADQVAHSGVPLQFKHPFALVKFVIAEGSGTNVQVNSISIGGLYTSGTCTYNGSTMTWGSYDGSAAMTITPEDPLKYGTSSTETYSLVVIPNNYGSKTLTVNGTWDSWSALTKDISTTVDINWQPGYIYTYNLTVTKYALKVDKEEFTEQW